MLSTVERQFEKITGSSGEMHTVLKGFGVGFSTNEDAADMIWLFSANEDAADMIWLFSTNEDAADMIWLIYKIFSTVCTSYFNIYMYIFGIRAVYTIPRIMMSHKLRGT